MIWDKVCKAFRGLYSMVSERGIPVPTSCKNCKRLDLVVSYKDQALLECIQALKRKELVKGLGMVERQMLVSLITALHTEPWPRDAEPPQEGDGEEHVEWSQRVGHN